MNRLILKNYKSDSSSAAFCHNNTHEEDKAP